jgi:hypothetical protein
MTFNDGSRCCRCWRQEAAKRNPRGWAKAQKEAKARRPARPRAACAARAQVGLASSALRRPQAIVADYKKGNRPLGK